MPRRRRLRSMRLAASPACGATSQVTGLRCYSARLLPSLRLLHLPPSRSNRQPAGGRRRVLRWSPGFTITVRTRTVPGQGSWVVQLQDSKFKIQHKTPHPSQPSSPRSHALRGNAAWTLRAPVGLRRRRASGRHSHAEHGNEARQIGPASQTRGGVRRGVSSKFKKSGSDQTKIS